MMFFTDITTQASNYCLLNIKKYDDIRKLNKFIIFIDPAVYELKHAIEYSKIEFMRYLLDNNLLRENEFISIDYPCDMNIEYSDLFIEKSIQNNQKYADNSHYICTIQSKFQDYYSFVREFEYLEPIIKHNPQKIVGIGNLCRIMRPNEFSDNVFKFIAERCQNRWVHLYGLSLSLIKRYVPFLESKNIKVSVDSTKWTKRVHKNPPLDKAICCRKENRDIYFLEYMNVINTYCKIKY